MDREDLTERDGDRAQPSDFSGAARAYLIVRMVEQSEVVEIPEHGAVIIGRSTETTIRIDDVRVSRRHAGIRWDSGALLLEDLGSQNGTRLNGELLRAACRTMSAGDCICIGGREIVVAIVAGRHDQAAGDGPASATLPCDHTGSKRHGTQAKGSTSSAVGPGSSETIDGVVVADPSTARVFGFARRVAQSSATALILGQTGVGKEVLAQQIHAWSKRAKSRFVRVNCAALPEPIVESELFGYERGAFTGAEKRKVGLVEAAHGGTLFLDEIGELRSPVQAKLLALLENRSIVRVGSTVETPVDVRVISATHRDLSRDVAEGRFREDLYYRLAVVVIRVPPLRERPSEISLLAELFARRFGQDVGFAEPMFDKQAFDALMSHAWPGNVRELRNAIEHALLVSEDGVIRREHLPDSVTTSSPVKTAEASGVRRGGVRAALAEVERTSIQEALRMEGGNRTRAARKLGISLRSLLYKIEKYGLGS